jgi:cell division septation protein DedD
MTTSGYRVAAPLLTLLLIAGCGADDTAADAAAPTPSSSATATATRSVPAATSSVAPSTTAPSSAAPSATVAAPATATPATATPVPSGATRSPAAVAPGTRAPAPAPAVVPAAAPATWPEEVPYPVEGRVWAVYVGVADGSAAGRARLDGLAGDLRAVGYDLAMGVTPVACETGAAEALGLDPAGHGLPVFLDSRQAVDQFLAAWDRPYVGFVQTTENCIA